MALDLAAFDGIFRRAYRDHFREMFTQETPLLRFLQREDQGRVIVNGEGFTIPLHTNIPCRVWWCCPEEEGEDA